MTLHTLIARGEKLIADNSPLILTGIGAVGVLTTAWLTGKASYRANDLLLLHRDEENASLWGDTKVVWKLYLPAAGSATITIAAIILANQINMRRAAALAAAYTLSVREAADYKEKVIEKLGAKKEKEVVDELASEKLKGIQTNHLLVGNTECLMLDTYTMKPFVSTMERVRKVENDLRELLMNGEKTITCDDWLKGIGLRPTPYSSDFGWNRESGFKLDYSAGLTDDNMPCLVWHFVIKPLYQPDPSEDVSMLDAPRFRS